MPIPSPLTETPEAKLDWSRPGVPVAQDFDDVYFSVDGGILEAQEVFLKGCGFPDKFYETELCVIGELGFGTGLNFLTTWKMFEDTRGTSQTRLHFISIEKYPLDKILLRRALSVWPEFKSLSVRLLDRWPGRVKGIHRLFLSDHVTLTLIHDDVASGLAQISSPHKSGPMDAWFLDGFSPSKNPDMWSPPIMRELARLSRRGTRLATFTVAGSVRTALADVGFSVKREPGFGCKRHRLEAHFMLGELRERIKAQRPIKPVIIGAGIAGASVARAFLRRGICPLIIDPDDGTAASANPVAIVKPRLDLQDRPESRYFLSAYLFACGLYRDCETHLSHGVFHLAQSPEDIERYKKLTSQKPLPPEHMRFEEGVFGRLGLNFPLAPVIDPVAITHALMQGANFDRQKISKRDDILSDFTHIIYTMGAGIREWELAQILGLRYRRGQISWARAEIDKPVTYGGYAIPHEGALLLGATHKHLDGGDPYQARPEDDADNIKTFDMVSGLSATSCSRPSRSSVRVTTAQTLPLMVEVSQNEWVLTGLGSRGFMLAPLLAEDMVSDICGEPNALANEMRERFQLREKIRPKNAPS